ncbi:MAG: aminotransferase class V-fold PLP-dependent enzyme [Thermomicrobiales bacterium]
MAAVQADGRTATTGGIYQRLGVRTIINGRGATTAVGGSLMAPEVLAAMAEAATAYVVLDELNRAVGERIAEATGAAAGYVTAGSSAGMALAAAACIAGVDPEKIYRLPDTAGLPNEIVIHRCHRIRYDHMFRLAGAKLVEIGFPQGTRSWELERAITERTVAVAWVDSPVVGHGALDFPTVVEIAHRHDVPAIVDAASTLPPVDHLRRWIRQGADLVIYSGGKGIRGPQESGMLAGRADLIEAARANGSPNAAMGRGMKVSKEAMAGLAVALDRFLRQDHEAEHRQHGAQAERIAAGLSDLSRVAAAINADPADSPAPVLYLRPVGEEWHAVGLRDALEAGNPSIHVNAERGALVINTHCLLPGEEEAILGRLRDLLGL